MILSPGTNGLRRLLLLALPAIVAIVCLQAPSPAGARTPLEQAWSRYDGWTLAGFRLEGAPPELAGELRKGLALAGEGRFLRSREYPEFSTRLLREDLARIRLFLAREGWPAAEVEPATVVPDARKRRFRLILRVDPGPEVRIARIAWEGWPEAMARPDSSESALVKQGERFGDRRLEAARTFLLQHLMDHGYALASVEAAVRPLNARSVAIEFAFDPGDRYDITSVTVRGCSPDLVGVTRRLIGIDPPRRFSRTLLDEAAFELRSTQLFRQVSLTVDSKAPGSLDLIADVENARMRSVETSVGTWSDNPWMVRAGWNHRNLLRSGRGVDAHAALATHTQSVGGGVTWFNWFAKRSRARLGAEWLREDEDAYLAKEWRLDLTRSRRPRGNDLAHLGVSLSRVSITPYSTLDQAIVDREGTLLELWADRKWDWTDDPLFPTRGGFAKITGTWSPSIGLSESPYLAVQGDASGYRPLSGEVVLAGRLRAGLAWPLGEAEALIPNRRFYAGGYSTMRGVGRRELGPRDADGLARGGEAVLLAGIEARIPVVWILDLALFLDSGQVWWKPGDVRLADLEGAAGIVLDVRTPLGPVRFGYAWNLGRPYPGDPDALAHFGVGYPW
ncbi:MAG: BamA/TamA family outer membrane protein [bacterium]